MRYGIWKKLFTLVPYEVMYAVMGAVMAILLVSSPLQAQSDDVVIMNVFLNAEAKGEYFFLLLSGKAAYFKVKDLKEIGLIGIFRGGRYGLYRDGRFKNERYKIKDNTYISLNSLYPKVRFNVDMKASALYITADPKLLESNVFDLSYKTDYSVFRPQDRSAFLNYSIRYSWDENSDQKSLGVPLEIGSNINGTLLFSNFSYIRENADEKLVRLNTNITANDSSVHSRLIMGDFSASSGELGSSGSFGGLSLSSSYATEPFIIKSPGLDLTFMIESPSEVEIYVNDLLVERRNLPPGEFTFSNLPITTGSGKVIVVIKDAYGRIKKFEKDFYTSSTLLKPGFHEYSYNLGFKREEFGEESFKYSEAEFLAFHRFGLSKYFTGGFRIETSGNVVNCGPTADFVIGSVGTIHLSLAGSYSVEELGYAGSLIYTYSTKGFNFRLSGKGFTKNYSTLSLTPFEDKPRLQSNAGFGFSLGRLGSLLASYTVTDRYDEMDMETTTLSYSLGLFNSLSFYANATRTESNDVVETASVNLSFRLGRNNSGSFTRNVEENSTSKKFSLQKNAPIGPGFGYRLLANQREADSGESEIDGNASIQYNGPYGVYSTKYSRSRALASYDLSASGAISFIDGSLHLSRPITDSFALAKVGKIEGVKVNSNNHYMGKTSSKGKLLIPNLTSFNHNKLSFEDKDIPINYEIGEIYKYVSTPFRAGGVVSFDLVKLQGFGGYIFFDEKGEKIPAKYAGLEIKTEEKLFETIVGRGGEFYLENIPSGKWPARLFLNDRHCAFKINFPESDEIYIDMGDIACEIK